MGEYEKFSKEELIAKIKELEDEVLMLRTRQNELESLLTEYSEIVKKQFEVFDDFIKDLGTKRMVDPLTRVYSKEHILKLISYYHQKAFEENFEYAIIMIKLTNIKDKEDFEKERIIITLGKVLREAVRVPLDSIGRYSYDSFLILLTEITKENAKVVEERIKKLISIKLPDVEFEIKMAVYPHDSKNLEELINIVNK
ncbi:diguanylate cyclase [Thermosipho melanesiensis]|uniref:Diguanylate cyclase n=2 Tax=Thermosipho melanesiensis TaxID=46541 RepID=A6LMI2_THEM4|nr:diguanylate cyclase [Thermosipho melanesiensis]ABR31133.1 diguanylate cyclase [Thermosipho melanesiensis BI429]APT74224.1 diguanylate cyclase [Thermosipho melanesiensis]OOC36167.1 diguanylate cyclase [Thermosipho melanesiensis]OOC36985.1 diguanylate cyclase [Thermosipho melanesiensis]OOC37737.1 diguanylate cyclase [Thermosipho melanesiensis]